jgi:hypothetical protein
MIKYGGCSGRHRPAQYSHITVRKKSKNRLEIAADPLPCSLERAENGRQAPSKPAGARLARRPSRQKMPPERSPRSSGAAPPALPKGVPP